MNRKKDLILTLVGVLIGLALGAPVATAALSVEPSTHRIYVDGTEVPMEAYAIGGHNYVKLQDIGRAVGFNVYWSGAGSCAVHIESDAPYTGEPPAETAHTDAVTICAVKGTDLTVGERSGLMIESDGTQYTVTSSNPAVVSVEQISGYWVAVANGVGTATVIVTAQNGGIGSVVFTVGPGGPATPKAKAEADLDANMEIRLEIVRLINQVRKQAGVPELTINDALMDAAQDCSAQGFTDHDQQYECEAALAYGYPYGAGANLAILSGGDARDFAQRAVTCWVNSPGHFQTLMNENADCIGVGVTVTGSKVFCYMFAGDPSTHNPYD